MALKHLTASGRLSLHASTRSLHARGISIASREHANSLHALWLIRKLRPTKANQDV